MIRAVAIGALLGMLVLVLYLPSAHPPERFLAQVRTEAQILADAWGDAPAARTLARAVDLQAMAQQATPMPRSSDAPAVGDVHHAVAHEMAGVNARLFGSSYFRAVDALMLLAAFRWSAMLEWLPGLSLYAVAVTVDGVVVRRIKSQEFRHHDPELFAVYACTAILALAVAAVCSTLLVTLHPLVMPLVPVVVATAAGRAIAHFHRRA